MIGVAEVFVVQRPRGIAQHEAIREPAALGRDVAHEAGCARMDAGFTRVLWELRLDEEFLGVGTDADFEAPRRRLRCVVACASGQSEK